MVLLLRKLYFTLQRIQRRSIIFRGRGGGVQLFPGGGGQLLISIETHIRTYYSRESVRTHYPPLDPHMVNVIITGQYLSQSGL